MTTPDVAVAAVQGFLSLEGLAMDARTLTARLGPASELNHPDLGPLWTFRSSLGAWWVSLRGQVVQYAGDTLPAQPGSTAPSALSALASGFAQRHMHDFRERNLRLLTPQVQPSRITWRWEEQARPGIELAVFPSWLEVTLSREDGRVLRASLSDLRLARSAALRVDEADVRARLHARFGPRSAVQQLVLMVLPRYQAGLAEPAQAITVWNASVMRHGEGGPVVDTVLIDVDSGAEVQPP